MRSPIILLLLSLYFLSFYTIHAQKVVRGSSSPTNFQMKTNYERGLPPKLFATLDFSDDNGNGLLEADESAVLKLGITNQGDGPAQALKISITDESNIDNNLTINSGQEIHYLYPGKSIDIKIPIKAGLNVNSGEHKLKINVLEHFGYDMDPAYLIVNTLEYQAPEIAFSGYEVVDYGEGTATVIEDGLIQPGEMVKVKLFVQNIGLTTAEEIKYKVSSNDPNIFIKENEGVLSNITVGDVQNFWVTLSPNKRLDSGDKMPLNLSVSIKKQKGSLVDYSLPIAFNKRPPQMEILQVRPDITKIQQQVARFEYNPNKFTANIGNIINIREDIPPAKDRHNDAVAVVFGIETYNNLPPAPFAENDARIIKEYFSSTLGIDNVIIYDSKTAKGLIFDDVFNPEYGELQRAIVKGTTNVFVFYSGHGLPSKDGQQIYLFPSDGKVERMDIQGYNLNKLYENLAILGAKSVTVFLDACFSGASKKSESIATENLISMKGIRVKPKLLQPWESNPNFSVFTSSGTDETSLALDASQTGLFTYYLCAGLKGFADLNGDNKITTGELSAYVQEQVMGASKKISGLQTPEFHGNSEIVLIDQNQEQK